MRVAFYAPLKAPTSPSPSGDRRMARLLVRAIGGSGHQVAVASNFRAFDRKGDPINQHRIKAEAESQITGLLEIYEKDTAPKPDLWFTYHLYHKAPDWIGPAISRALDIPYVVAEASVAPKRAGGPWDMGHRGVLRALEEARMVIGFNDVDAICVRDVLKPTQCYETIAPFIDETPYLTAAGQRLFYRAMAAGQYGLEPGIPWLLTVAMMRPGDKLESYRQLAAALEIIRGRPWQLLIVGDGEARPDVRSAFDDLDGRVHWLGRQESEYLAGLYAAADLYVWPAVNEAFGMAFLEAQSAGLPVVAGNAGGVATVVHAPDAGELVPTGDATAFAGAITGLLDAEGRRQSLGLAAQRRMRAEHGLDAASERLDALLRKAITSCD